MLVPVSHPVHVTAVPRGARRPRTHLVTDVTPVDLVRAGRGAMEPLAVPPELAAAFASHVVGDLAGDLALSEGVAWVRLRDMAREPLAPARFADYLRGDPGEDGEFNPLNATYQRSPLAAHVVYDARPLSRRIDQWTRGEAFEDAAQKEILADARGTAGDRVSAFLRGEFRLAEDAVYARFRPGACPRHFSGDLVIQHLPMLLMGSNLALDPSAVDPAAPTWKGALPDPARFLAARDLLPRRTGDDAVLDLVRLANWAAVRTRPHVTAEPPSFLRRLAGARALDALAAAAARLAPFEARGALGDLGVEDAHEVLRLAADAWDAYADTLLGGRLHFEGVETSMDYVRSTGLERLVNHRASPEDIEALSRMRP
jgi:hypothetical protein